MPCIPIGIIKGKQGEKGIKGDKGDKGDPGEKGDTGAQGQAGIDGTTDTPSQILNKLKNVDGSGSELDADLLDGYDSSYFAKSEDIDAALATEHVPLLGSAIHIYRSGNSVWLNFEPWTVNRNEENTYVATNLNVPVGWEPPRDVYIANILPNDVRIKIEPSGKIKVFVASGTTNKYFAGSTTWLIN